MKHYESIFAEMINLNSFTGNISPYCLLDVQNNSQLKDNYCQTLQDVEGR